MPPFGLSRVSQWLITPLAAQPVYVLAWVNAFPTVCTIGSTQPTLSTLIWTRWLREEGWPRHAAGDQIREERRHLHRLSGRWRWSDRPRLRGGMGLAPGI